jgi:serine/threonine-protein kinase
MRDASFSGISPLPLSARRRVDEACDRFEAAWRAGPGPRAEEFLGDLAGPERLALLRELIPLEVYYRRQWGQECRPEDYAARFPDFDPAWLATALSPEATALSARPLLPPSSPADTVVLARPGPAALPGAAGGRYRLLEEVGRGGMGVVHKGRDPHLGRELAVKILREHHQDDPEAVRRFVGEARIAGQLQHPGVVPVYELGNFLDGRPFFTMKLVHGRTLAQLLTARRGPGEDLPRLLKVFEQVCQTVAYAHSKGVIHRDLKPANVMVGAFGEVQVMDWGLAKVLGEDPAGSREPPRPEAGCMAETGRPRRTEPDTEPGAVLGTYAYMAPEQARGAVGALDERCDVFGLGAILCEILTGQPPYTAAESWQVYPKAAMADLGEAHGRLDGCGADAELVALAKRCLAVEPANRPRDAGAVAAAVTTYLEGVQERLRRAELERAAAQARAAEERKRRRVAAALAAAVVLLVVVGGGGWLWVSTDRAARRARADAALEAALDRAERLQSQARAHSAQADNPAGAEAVLALWRQGLAAAEQAREAAAAALVGDAAARRAERVLARLRAGVEQAGKDARLLIGLDEARLARSVWQGRFFDDAASARLYALAFAAYGLNVRGSDPSATAQALRRLPARMRRALIVTLDDWAACASKKETARHLRRVAGRADDDPWRRRFRQATDLDTLKELAVAARRKPPPPVSLDLLADRLLRGGARAEAVTLLREAQRRHPGDFWLNVHLGNALWAPDQAFKQGLDESIGYRRVAVALRPRNPALRSNLGIALAEKGDAVGAIAEYRTAIGLDVRHAPAHINLGIALYAQGDLPGAIAEYRTALRIDCRLVSAHHNLGVALYAKADREGAIAEYRTAVALNPKFAPAHTSLGLALYAKGDKDGAIAEHRKALALEPNLAEAHNNLGIALEAKGDLKGAIAEYRKALRIRPQDIEPLFNLGRAARQEGYLQESLAAFRRGHELAARRPGWRYPSGDWVKKAERLVELNRQLPAFLKGERHARGAAGRLELAQLCGYTKRFAAGVGFYRVAFAADRKSEAAERYNAACLAVLAGCGRGNDAAGLAREQRAELRSHALAWLRADLARWQERPRGGKLADQDLGEEMDHWQTDPDLAGVRDQAALAKLPDAERKEWTKLWGEVAAQSVKAGSKK